MFFGEHMGAVKYSGVMYQEYQKSISYENRVDYLFSVSGETFISRVRGDKI